MITIIWYPRLNLDQGNGIPHFGLMHLVATNMIIWINTVIKESIMEFEEAEEKDGEDATGFLSEPLYQHLINNTEDSCSPLSNSEDYMYSIVRGSSPILFAFIIEFVLIGATVFYNMWHHVKPYNIENTTNLKHENPHIREVLLKTDWSHSLHGSKAGLVVATLNIITLCVFFGLASDKEVIDEYIEKISRTVTNSIGIVATCIGLLQIQKLMDKCDPEDTAVDGFLLNLGGTFSYLYMCFTITVGMFTTDLKDIPGSLHIVNGVIDIVQMASQIVLINLLLKKVNTWNSKHLLTTFKKVIKSENDDHPGRQAITFLVFFNLTLWLVDTFELQKNKASLVESEFYGPVTWVWLQRLTLPLAIFFR